MTRALSTASNMSDPRCSPSSTHTPVHSLAPETLMHIFASCIEESHCQTFLCARGKVIGPLILGSVCFRWRKITEDNRSLWTNINLRLDCIWDAHIQENLYNLLQLCLQRAAGGPLTLSLIASGSYTFLHGPSAAKYVYPLLDLVGKYSQHWSTVRMCLPDEMQEYISKQRLVYPNLQSVVIAFHPENKLFPPLFNRAPNLRFLGLTGCGEIPSISSLALPFEQLDDLFLIYHENVSSIINACVKLKRLHVDLCYEEGVIYDGSEIVDAVTSPIDSLLVRLGPKAGSSMEHFLRGLTLPGLKGLHVENYDWTRGDEPQPFQELLDRSRCGLEHFSMLTECFGETQTKPWRQWPFVRALEARQDPGVEVLI